ncbi:MAG: winged helix-turn-helix domain-containing protein [Acidobacteriota bacterium]
MPQVTKALFEFGDFRFDAERRTLWRGSEMVALAPKATEVLCLLIEARGDLVQRDEIIDRVWSDTFVEEGNLNHAISALRKALGGDGIIQTVPRRGYRFSAEIKEIADPDGNEVFIEKRTLSQTTIEESEELVPSDAIYLSTLSASIKRFRLPVFIALIMIGAISLIFYLRAPSGNNLQARVNSHKTLVILPLRSLTGNDDDTALALGISENLASRLGELNQLIVRPTSTAGRLAELGDDPIAIGQKLGADAVLDGSYQKSDGRIRVLVRLLTVPDGAQIWAGNFDESEKEVFKLQDSLAYQAAVNLTDRLMQDQTIQLAKRSTDNVEAYRLYTRGRYEWTKRTKDGFDKSIAAYRQAIDLDPSFSLAYAGLADSYVLLAEYFVEAPVVAFPKAKAAALRALELDPSSTRARTTLAYILATYDWNYAEAERQYRTVIDTEPNYATAHHWYGEMLGALRRYPEADAELLRAAELDPLVPTTYSERAILLYYEGKLDESLAQLSILKREHPQYPSSYIFSSFVYKLQGLDEKAFEEEFMYWKVQGESEETLKEMSDTYSRGGLPAFLKSVGERLESEALHGAPASYKIVNTFARLGDREKTLYWMDKCVEAHDPLIIKMASDRNFDFVRNEPRFQEALKKINYPQ